MRLAQGRRPAAAVLVVLALGGACSAEGQGTEMAGCATTPVAAQVERLRDELGDRPGRFIVTLASADEAARDEVARALREVGALMVEAIASQPLLVVEIGVPGLAALMDDPRIVCVQRDRPEPPAR